MLTLSIIKADTGGYVGHTAMHLAMIDTATRELVAVPRTSEAIALDDVVKQIHDAGVAAAYELIDDGDTSGRLAGYAADLPASIVALATHGRTGLARVALGSVAMRVVRTSACPVLVVRPDLQD